MDRREFLAAAGSGVGLFVAGCTESDGGTTPTGSDVPGTATPTSTPTSTGTPTDAPTDGGGEGGGGGGGETATVIVGPDGELAFEPERLRIPPGTTVRFVWESDDHNVTVDEHPPDADWEGTPGDRTEVFETGYVYTHLFGVEGTYEYYCAPHRSAGMVGSVVVDPSTDGDRDSYESETDIDAVADDWPQFSATAGNVGHRATTAPGEFVPAWRQVTDQTDTTTYPPVVADGRVYTWESTRILALDAASGAVEWSVTDEASGWTGNAGPTVAGGVLYAGQSDGMTALDAATGAERWRSDFGTFVTSAPAASDDGLFFTTHEADEVGGVRALDRETGDPRWHREFDHYAFCTPGTDGSTVVVASQEATLYALDATTGTVKWAFDGIEGTASAPAVADGRVYVVDGGGTVRRLDLATGDVEWEYDAGGTSVDSPILVDGTVVGTTFVDDGNGAVWRVDAETGAERWRTVTDGSGHVASAAADGLVFVSLGQRVAAFDLSTGRKRHERDLGVSITDPVVADGVVFVGGEEIHALAAP
jgi:plastocyanin